MISQAALVAQLEMRKRFHSTRWISVLAVWIVTLFLVTAANFYLLPGIFGVDDSSDPSGNASVASLLIHFTALIGITIATSSAASSLNGDRENGMLALMQATPISGWGIVLGKTLAAWINGLLFLIVSIPFSAVMIRDSPQIWEGFALGYLVASIELLAFAGIGIGWSALTPRPGGSAALAVFTVLAFLLGPPIIIMGLENVTAYRADVTATNEYEQYWDEQKNEPIPENDPRYGQKICEEQVHHIYISYVSEYWWLALADPIVAVSDSMPDTVRTDEETVPKQTDCTSGSCEDLDADLDYHIFPNRTVVSALASMKQAPSYDAIINGCGPQRGKVVFQQVGNPKAQLQVVQGHYWGITVSLHIALGMIMVVVAGRRTRVPLVKLPRGTRIA